MKKKYTVYYGDDSFIETDYVKYEDHGVTVSTRFFTYFIPYNNLKSINYSDGD